MATVRFTSLCLAGLLATAWGCAQEPTQHEVRALGDISETVAPPAALCQAGFVNEKEGGRTWFSRDRNEGAYLQWHRQAWRACLEGLIASKGQKAPPLEMLQGWPPEIEGNAAGHALALRQFEAAKAKYGLDKALELAAQALQPKPAP
ncbi:MAG: hypothetical protein NTV86_15065 [Planctomycetota bacterium]|nr:hypothetical protein [Planctomycetota bacterium]